jgi:hypothetical protein
MAGNSGNMSAAIDLQMAERAGVVLTRKYPLHAWHVLVEGGMLTVRNLDLSGKWGFSLKAKNVTDALIMRAGGELLERYRVSRGAAKASDLANLRRDIFGYPMGDLA